MTFQGLLYEVLGEVGKSVWIVGKISKGSQACG